MAAEVNQSEHVILTKILAWIVEGMGGNVAGSTGQASVLNAAAASSNKVVKASAGRLFRVSAFNSSGGKVYLQVFDAIAMPLDGTIPTLAPVAIAADGTATIDFGTRGRPFTTGIVVAGSSTGATLTNTTGLIFDATFI